MSKKPSPPSVLHDADAQNDEKCLALRQTEGWAGYGLFWAMVEKMRVATDYRLKFSTLPALAFGFGMKVGVLQKVVDRCVEVELFARSDDQFWAPSLVRRMEAYSDKCRKNKENAVLAVAARGRSPNGNRTVTDRPPNGDRGVNQSVTARSSTAHRAVTLRVNNKQEALKEEVQEKPSTGDRPVSAGSLVGALNEKLAAAKKRGGDK